MTVDQFGNMQTLGDLIPHGLERYTIGRPVPPRVAAMPLALQRVEAHYKLEGFPH